MVLAITTNFDENASFCIGFVTWLVSVNLHKYRQSSDFVDILYSEASNSNYMYGR